MGWPSIRRETDRETPWTVKVLCMVGIVSAVFGLFVGPWVALLGAVANAPLAEQAFVILVGLGLLALSAAQIYALGGLLALKMWAWKASLALFAVHALVALYLDNLWNVAFNVLVLLYLLGQKIHFTEEGPQSPLPGR